MGGSEDGIANRSCVLKLGKVFRLSTFGAQGLADMLNSVEEWTQRMAGTKASISVWGVGRNSGQC